MRKLESENSKIELTPLEKAQKVALCFGPGGSGGELCERGCYFGGLGRQGPRSRGHNPFDKTQWFEASPWFPDG